VPCAQAAGAQVIKTLEISIDKRNAAAVMSIAVFFIFDPFDRPVWRASKPSGQNRVAFTVATARLRAESLAVLKLS
jgi:hypothetical protein